MIIMLAIICSINTDAYPLPTGIFGSGSNIHFLDEVQCLGSESNLLDCQHGGISNFYSSCDIVNIACKGTGHIHS